MWKLVPPRTRKDGKKIEFYYIRGKYLGIRLDHSTGTGEARAARAILKTWREQAERGEFGIARKAEHEAGAVTFAKAAIAYMNSGGDGRYLEPILKAWPDKPLTAIDQIAVDTLAAKLYPKATAATRNRQVYTPVSAVLKRVGIVMEIKRPVGWKGKKSMSWLEPEQAFALFDEAGKIEAEFLLLCQTLLYTGMRIDEALSRQIRHLNLDRAFIYLDDSKTGEPRGCHLPPVLVQAFRAQPPRLERQIITRGQKGFIAGGGGRAVEDAGMPFLKRRPDAKLFRYHDGGRLRAMLKLAMKKARLSFPRREGGFHIFCHTYGSWMTQFGGLDTDGLTRTGRWADPASAARYKHTQASEEAQRSDRLPTSKRGLLVDIKAS